jgi:putative ABC transport system permease protein
MQAQFGIGLKLSTPSATEWALLASVLVAGLLASLIPGLRAYRLSLADGLSPRT